MSGSEDEAEHASILRTDAQRGLGESVRQKLFVRLKTGEKVSIWKSLVLNDGESVCLGNDNVLGGVLERE